MVALMSSLMALATDAMLPAFPQMIRDLGVSEYNQIQLTVSLFMLGAGIGQLFFGPLADFKGRRIAILAGILIFILGGIICALATNFEMMIFGRLVMGLGVAGPRTGSVAMVRDQFSGREMARVMSFIMMVFILVPAIAPAIGLGAMMLAGWRAIFLVFIATALISFFWMGLRQPETNPASRRQKFSWGNLAQAVKFVLTNRQTMIFTLAAACSFGGFIAYLGTAQQIFVDIFDVGDAFAAYFGLLALAIGAAAFANAKMVVRLGMRYVARRAFIAVAAFSTLYFCILLMFPAAENLVIFLIWAMGTFFATGLLFGNINALAMEPMGKSAGIATALIGAISTALAVAIGIPIGMLYDGTVLPIIGGFAVFSTIGFVLMLIAGPVSPDP